MKRIGMVLDNPFLGDNRVINEAVHLQEKGFEVHVLGLNYGKHAPVEDYKGIRVRRIPIPEKLKNYFFAFYHWLPIWNWFWKRNISQFVRDFSIDVLHAHDLYMVASCAGIAREKKIPLVVDLHENYPAAVLNYQWTKKFPGNLIARPKQWKKIEGKLLAQADRLVVLSDYYRDLLCLEYPKLQSDQFTVYPNVPDHQALMKHPVGSNPLPYPESSWLFYFGVISERRGIYTAIEALKKLRRRGHNARLLLAGNVNKAEELEFNRRISDPETKDYILHIPWIDIAQFPTYANACMAGLSPIFSGDQHDIGIANKVFQYMLFKLPVIASDSKAQSQLIEENECGLVFEDRNSDDLALRIEELITTPGLGEKLGRNGREAILNSENLENYGKRLSRLYENL